MYKQIIRSILFKFDPEAVHYFTFRVLKLFFKIPFSKRIVCAIFQVNHPKLKRELFGLKFNNPVGLAAGFDKNAVLYNELANFGFGFIEIGTVTPKAQDGNPKKRLFRLKADAGLINRMGFNNAGLEALISNLKQNKNKVIIGGNIGKNTQTSPAHYTADYAQCFKALHSYVDYFVLNVSCPNVGSHAKLTDKDYLEELICEMKRLNAEFEVQKPILLKIAPDLNQLQLDEIIGLIAKTEIAGVIACNTSVSRAGLQTPKAIVESIGNGGLSGQPIKSKSTEVIRYLSKNSKNAFAIIGVGGIHSAEDALEKIQAGADLVQIYTGFVYEGPSLVKRINKALINT
jgi:dihydroorotate dehydrogenase